MTGTPEHQDVLLDEQPVVYQPPKDLLMVAETIYHRPGKGQTTGIREVTNSELGSGEEPYQALHHKISEEWERIDVGWLEETGVSMIHIKNNPVKRHHHPSPEEVAAEAEAVLELSYRPDTPVLEGWEIKRGHTFRGCPMNPGRLYIRCRKGTTRYSLLAIPS